MRATAYFLCSLAFVPATMATILTVSNNGFPAQYTSLVTAINEADPGDTLHIAASSLSYGNITLSKSLTLMGEVAWPATGSSTWLGYLALNPGAEGARIIGLSIQHGSTSSAVEINCDDILIERCMFYRTITLGSSNGTVNVTGTHSGLIIRHCYIAGGQGNNSSRINLNNMSNVLIANNVIHNGGTPGTNEAAGSLITNSNQPNVTFANNIFIHNYGSGSSFRALTATVHNALVVNNVFWGPQAIIDASVTGCIFNNNLQWQTNGTALPIPNNSGTGNLVVDPQFMNAPDRAFTNMYDYTPQLPAAMTGGTDGTAIGIAGGSLPWPNNYGYPRAPRVVAISLGNESVPLGGNVNVTTDGTKVD